MSSGVACLPTGRTNETGDNPTKSIMLGVPSKPVWAVAMATAEGKPADAVVEDGPEGKILVTVSESPVYLHMKLK